MQIKVLTRIAAGTMLPVILLLCHRPAAAQDNLKIVVLEGEDGANIIKKKTAVRPVVEVRDKNNLPVAGATVVFAAPHSGATAVFANDARSVSVLTNSAGRAAVASMKPVGTGAFKLSVSASVNGQVATTTISQTNYLTVAAAHAAGAGGSAGSSGGAGGGASGAVGGSAATSTAGMSAAAVGGIAAGGAAAVGVGVAAAKGVIGGGGGNSCSAQADKVISDYNDVKSCINSLSTTAAQCEAKGQSGLSDLAAACTCAGGVPQSVQQYMPDIRNLATTWGYQVPASCGN